MARRIYRPEQIINKLREAEVLLSQGSSAGKAAGKIVVVEQTLCADGRSTVERGLGRS